MTFNINNVTIVIIILLIVSHQIMIVMGMLNVSKLNCLFNLNVYTLPAWANIKIQLSHTHTHSVNHLCSCIQTRVQTSQTVDAKITHIMMMIVINNSNNNATTQSIET